MSVCMIIKYYSHACLFKIKQRGNVQILTKKIMGKPLLSN